MARSLAHLRRLGYVAEVVEQRVHRFVTRDFLGVIDVLGVKPGEPLVGVQATSTSNLAARRKKALAEPRLRTWLEAGAVFLLHGWAKRGPAGKRKLWTVTEEAVTLADLPTDAEQAGAK
jgi:hypothetical protein